MKCFDCPRNCGADRAVSRGFCGAGDKLLVARAAPHFWEEPCISGSRGSGAVFFSGCSLGCVFCQNYDISHRSVGKEITVDELLEIFDRLVSSGVHNLNLVTPTHFVRVIAEALERYDSPVPVVWNSSGYEKVESLRMLEGLVDIYLPDFKYFTSSAASKLSDCPDYFDYASEAVTEMYRQVGGLKENGENIAQRGLIVRHLVLPGLSAETENVLEWLDSNLPSDIGLSLLRQYVPFGEALHMPGLDRRVTTREYFLAKRKVLDLSFENCFFQSSESSSEEFIPEFDFTGV